MRGSILRLILVLTFFAAPFAAAAPQAGKVSHIGILGQTAADPSEARLWEIFRLALRERGWIEGENLRIESRWAEDDVARIPALAAELVRLRVDLIVTRGSIFVEGTKKATASLPIVFTMHADPVGTGHVASLARPGGHVTGLTVQLTDLYVKGVEFLRAAVPEVTRIAVLWSSAAPSHPPGLTVLAEAARTLQVQFQPVEARSEAELEEAFAGMASLTRNTQRDWKVRYHIYYPDGTSRVALLFRAAKRDAEILLGQASQLESITRQNALTPETAVPFLHWRLLKPEDLARWFPGRRGPLSWDPDALLGRYLEACHERMTSPSAIHRNGFRADKLLGRLGNLSRLTVEGVRAWRQDRLRQVARKTVNLEHDVLRQLLDECQRLGWRPDNPARQVDKLPWKLSRLPQALTYAQVQMLLPQAQELGALQPPQSLKGSLYRLVVAGVFSGYGGGNYST